MSDPTNGVPDLEAPPADAFEQSLPVTDGPEDPVPEALTDDLEAPEPDVIEQHQSVAPSYEDEDWR
ncbi:MAG: hypothetical protein QOG43_2417 [Actinomycetota bacterium]|jgi:hypothetical protein|nr:hypothetical protein [Actinomycetota bacterium]